MKKILPKPRLIPIRVNVVIQSKNNLKIENVYVKPYENVNDIIKLVEEY